MDEEWSYFVLEFGFVLHTGVFTSSFIWEPINSVSTFIKPDQAGPVEKLSATSPPLTEPDKAY